MTEPTGTIETLDERSPAEVAVGQDRSNSTATPLLVLFGENDLLCIDETCVARDGLK